MRAASDGSRTGMARERNYGSISPLVLAPAVVVDYLTALMEPEEAEKLCGANNVPHPRPCAPTPPDGCGGLLTR